MEQAHPIILKWIIGSARIIGKPALVKLSTDNQLNQEIKVFHCNHYWHGKPADYYILYFDSRNNQDKVKRVLCVNIQDGYIGLPAASNERNYDIIMDRLFQSEGGAQFTFMGSDKGYGFDAKMIINNREVAFSLPKDRGFGFSSVRLIY